MGSRPHEQESLGSSCMPVLRPGRQRVELTLDLNVAIGVCCAGRGACRFMFGQHPFLGPGRFVRLWVLVLTSYTP